MVEGIVTGAVVGIVASAVVGIAVDISRAFPNTTERPFSARASPGTALGAGGGQEMGGANVHIGALTVGGGKKVGSI